MNKKSAEFHFGGLHILELYVFIEVYPGEGFEYN